MRVQPFSYLGQKAAAPVGPGTIVTQDLLFSYDANNPASFNPSTPSVVYDLVSGTHMEVYGTTTFGTYGGVTKVFYIPGNSSSWIGFDQYGYSGIDIASGISMEIWAYFPAFPGADWFYNLYNTLNNSGNVNRQMIRMETTATGASGNSGTVSYDRYSTNTNTLTPTTSISTGNWYHFFMTYSPGSFGYYVNGVSAGTPTNFTIPTTYFGTSQTLWLYLSRRDDRATDNMEMYASEWRFYSRDLTSAEVLQNYNATKARFGY